MAVPLGGKVGESPKLCLHSWLKSREILTGKALEATSGIIFPILGATR